MLTKEFVESKKKDIQYEDYMLPPDEDSEWKEESIQNSTTVNDRVKLILREPFLVRDGFFSAYAYCNRYVSEELSFDLDDKFEWMYASFLVNSPSKFWFVFTKMGEREVL